MKSSHSRRSGFVRLALLVVLGLAIVVAILLLLRSRRAGASAAMNKTNGSAAGHAAIPAGIASQTSAGAVAAEDFVRMLDEARSVTDPRVRSREFGVVLQRWLARDPAAALSHVRGLPQQSAEFTQGLLMALGVIGKTDPARAIQLAGELATTRAQLSIYSSLFAALAERDRPFALRYLTQVPAGAARENALRAIAETWGRSDSPAALAWAQGLSGTERDNAVESVVLELVAADPLRAIQVAQETLSGDPLNRALVAALRQLVTVDVQAAAAIVPLLPAGETQLFAATDVARALAAKNPAEALAWASKLPTDGRARNIAVARALETWATSDSMAAARYVQTMAADELQRDAALAVSGFVAPTNPPQAMAWAQSFTDPEVRSAAQSGVADAWTRRDPEAAARWFAAQPIADGDNRTSAELNGALSYWALRDKEGARRFVDALSPVLQRGAAETLAPLLAQNDPAGTIAWAQGLSGVAARDAAVTAAYRRWLDNAPVQARAWLASAALAPELKARLQRKP